MTQRTFSSPALSDVSIVVLCYNRKDIIGNHLAALVEISENTGCELIVVDNASQDGSAEIISDAAKDRRNVQVLLNDQNLGVSEGRNVGWRRASRKYIASLDEDIQISSRNLESMIVALNEDAKIGLVSPDISDSYTGKILNKSGSDEAESAASFYEACFLLPKSIVQEIGYLDSNLKIAGEGLDYSLRLRRAGYRIKRLSSAQAVHVDRSRVGAVLAQRRRDWLWSFCYVYWKNMGVASALYHSTRVILAHARAGGRLFGISFVLSLPLKALAGARAGRSVRGSAHE